MRMKSRCREDWTGLDWTGLDYLYRNCTPRTTTTTFLSLVWLVGEMGG